MGLLLDKLSFFSVVLTVFSISASPHPLILILVYLIHELGHLFFAKILGAKIKKFTIGAFHLSMSYDCSYISYVKEALVCLGGIIFNVVSAMFVLLFPFLSGEKSDFFVLCSLALALMNLYPAKILDGGGLLLSMLSIFTTKEKADKISGGVSAFAIILIWLISVYFLLVFNSSFSLFVISVALLMELCFSINT